MAKALALTDGLESTWTRLISAPGLALTTTITILLLWSDLNHWKETGLLYQLVRSDRSTIQLVIQVLAGGFGAVHAYTLSCLVNLSTRLRLANKPYALDQMRFWKALCSQALDWSIPLHLLLPLLVFKMALLAPAAFYAGAMTPVIMSATIQANLNTSRYSDATKTFWGHLNWTSLQSSVWSNGSLFTYSPNYGLQGLILNNAASASVITGNGTRSHNKIDNTGYAYNGRSYGVASSVGLVDRFPNTTNVTGYAYNETGYISDVSCIINATADWALTGPIMTPMDGTYPNLYLASGSLANGHGERYSACGLGSSAEIFALVGSTSRNTSIFSIAAGQNYAAFDKVQCKVIFTSAFFTINVDSLKRLITVSPLAGLSSPVPDIEPTGSITSFAMRLPTSISQQHACDLYTSSVGNVFTQNVRNTHPSLDSSQNKSDTVTGLLSSIEDSLASMPDDSLLALSSAQLMIANDAVDTPANLSVEAVRIGESRYIYIVAAIHFTIVLIFLVEILRTRMWRGLIQFDYMDLKSVIIGSAIGGSAIAQQVKSLCREAHRPWHGDRGDRAAGKVLIKVARDDLGTRLIGVEQQEDSGQKNHRIEKGRSGPTSFHSYELVPSRDSRLAT